MNRRRVAEDQLDVLFILTLTLSHCRSLLSGRLRGCRRLPLLILLGPDELPGLLTRLDVLLEGARRLGAQLNVRFRQGLNGRLVQLLLAWMDRRAVLSEVVDPRERL